jgi:phytoene dehydrogenase-like protein
MGVIFRFSEKVTTIAQKNGRAHTVKTDAHKYSCDEVVYGGDVVRLYEALGNVTAKQKVSMPERSTSAVVFYWEVRGAYKQFGLHNIIFSDDYSVEYDQLRRGEVPTDPTIYINITSKAIPEHAAKGTENWFVMVNVPAGTKDFAVLSVKETITKKLEAMLGGYITILNEEYLSPSKLDAYTGAWQGAIYGQATNSFASLLARPKNHIKNPKNVYTVGGTVHPGGGIPLAARSAIIVADQL